GPGQVDLAAADGHGRQVARSRQRRRRRHGGGVGGGRLAGRVGGRDAEEVGTARRPAPPGGGGGGGAGRGELHPVDPVARPVQLEAVLGAGVVGPGQVDLAAADGHGRQVARRRQRSAGGVGRGGFAGRVVGRYPEIVVGSRRGAPPG